MKIKHTLYIILLTASLIPLYIFASVMIVQNNKKHDAGKSALYQ